MPIENVSLTPEEIREKEMVEAFVRGDMAGFKYVYARYRQRIFSYCVYYMSDHALAEDAFQEVFSRVYTRREQLREVKALKSWLLLITRSVCLNMLRTSKFAPEFVSIDLNPDSESPIAPLAVGGDPSEKALADDMLKVALARLAPIYREAFLMREFEGYEYDEIARLTNTTEMNVKVRITRAKKQLRVLLAPYYKHEASQTRKRKSRKDAANDAGIEELNVDLAQEDDRSSVDDRSSIEEVLAR
jgi:RNA polymerase sigma-70 factor (ECF subfamily)